MVSQRKLLQLYEALELRADYLARIGTIKELLEEGSSKSGRGFYREPESVKRPSPDFDPAQARDELKKLELKQRKLNSAIQKANFEARVDFEGEEINLLEALEVRKGVKLKIAELKKQSLESAYQTVILKEGRDIVETGSVTFAESYRDLDAARKSFRELNRKLRRASFEVTVDYFDE
jgi:hypothetical protein